MALIVITTSGDLRHALSITDPSIWPDVQIINVDASGHFDVVISGWRCLDGTIYPPPDLAAGAGWRDALAELFLRGLAGKPAFQSTEPDSE